MSVELDLIVAPRATYAALARGRGSGSVLTAVRRPLLVALVLGVSVALSATHSLSPALVASTTLSWSYLVVLQLAIALPLLAGPARRTIGLPRAIDLFFAGHAPWSIYALFAAAWVLMPRGWMVWPLVVMAAVPAALTARIVHAYFAEALSLDARAARRRTIAQQAVTWTVAAALIYWTSALAPRLIEIWSRW